MTRHDTIRALASAELDFELSATDRTEVTNHLADCSACRRFREGIGRDAENARQWPRWDAPRSLLAPAMVAATAPRSLFRDRLVLRPGSAFVVVLLILAALIGAALAVGAWRLLDRSLVLPTGDWIAYSSEGRLLLVRPDGMGRVDLATGRTNRMTEPVWSPDGQHLALIVDHDVAVLDADGRLTKLTNDDVRKLDPAWSPDGAWLAFGTDLGTIEIVRAGGTDRRVLIDGSDGPLARWPSWSADGQVIAFLGSDRADSPDGPTRFTSLREVRVDGTLMGPGFYLQRGGARPSWRGDGRLVFDGCMCKGGPHSVVWSILESALVAAPPRSVSVNGLGPDGGDPPTTPAFDSITSWSLDAVGSWVGYRSPSWSPDGSRMAAFRAPSFELVVIAPDGTVRLVADAPFAVLATGGPASPAAAEAGGEVSSIAPPVWAPDGQRVAYQVNRGFAIADVDGGRAVVVHAELVDGLDWRPTQR